MAALQRTGGRDLGYAPGAVRVVDQRSFYYYHITGWRRFFNRQVDEIGEWAALLRRGYVAHYWNHAHMDMHPVRGSLMFRVLNSFRLQELGDELVIDPLMLQQEREQERRREQEQHQTRRRQQQGR